MTPLEAQVQIIPISKIVISKTNPRKVFNEESLNQLSKSIAENGLQQAILLRPKGAKFELVFGERRLKAKQLLKEKTIEARVQKLTDKQALEIQLIENKERQDVHPLNEAISIQKLLEFKNNSVSEISKILARSESYVTQRLQLIKLTDQWKNTYFEHKEMTLSVGLLVSKLSESDQNSVFKQAIGNDGLIRRYKEIHNIVERLINDLEKSIFSLEEENITPNLSSCAACVKRSGINTLLFSDLTSSDICFDSPCFELKTAAQALKNITAAVEVEEPILFIQTKRDELSKKVGQLVKSHKVPVLAQYKDFYNHFEKKGKNKLKAIWLNGDDFGKTTFIEVVEEKEEVRAKKMVDCTPKEQIDKIEIRENRSKELDAEKVYTNIMNSLNDSPELNKVDFLKTTDIDKAMQRLLIFNSLSWEVKEKAFKMIKHDFSKSRTKKNITAYFLKFSEEQMTYLVRKSVFEQYSKMLRAADGTLLLRLFAEQCKSVPVVEIEAAQKDIAIKRQEKQKERIEVLKSKSKN